MNLAKNLRKYFRRRFWAIVLSVYSQLRRCFWKAQVGMKIIWQGGGL